MRDDICTIPISEVFEHKDGCPVCRMRNMLEERMVEYVLGAAMMEPDVRERTNELGFCSIHLNRMMNGHKRLPLALILETHLDYLKKDLFKKSLFKPSAKKQAYKTARICETCFVCDRVEWGMSRLMATMFKTYSEQYDFRELFRQQEYICLPHYKLLSESAPNHLEKKTLSDFNEAAAKLTEDYLGSLYDDVHKFTKMFDYRNSGEDADWGSSRDSIERSCLWLTSRNGE